MSFFIPSKYFLQGYKANKLISRSVQRLPFCQDSSQKSVFRELGEKKLDSHSDALVLKWGEGRVKTCQSRKNPMIFFGGGQNHHNPREVLVVMDLLQHSLAWSWIIEHSIKLQLQSTLIFAPQHYPNFSRFLQLGVNFWVNFYSAVVIF